MEGSKRRVAMTMKSLSLFALLFVLLPLHAYAEDEVPLLGGWKTIKNVNDPELLQAGEFAVSEYNKQSKGTLKFVSVVKGEIQVVEGWNFRLDLAAEDGSGTKNYQAVVWVKPWEKFEKLVSFEPVQA